MSIAQRMNQSEVEQHRLFPDDVLFFQRFLKAEGHDPGFLDGIDGRRTRAAAARHYMEYVRIRSVYGSFSERTEKVIRTLTAATQVEARRFLAEAAGQLTRRVELLSGTRTYAQQNELYAQGRYGDTRRVVTQARGGHSNHNFGIAFDIGVFGVLGRYMTKDHYYIPAGELSRDFALEWSGDWPKKPGKFAEVSHFQLAMPQDLQFVRNRFEQGQTFYA